jgi:hypothetical protein
MKRLKDGFYWLTGPSGEDGCLVKVYTAQYPPCKGIGFGAWDGGGFMPLRELKKKARLTPVEIVMEAGK